MKPALTAEEWETFEGIQFAGEDSPIPEATKASDRADLIEESVNGMERPNFHRVAALALYGQPFGFTREDAEQLRWAAYCMDEAGIVHADGDDLRVVADLIEVLLPPEVA